MLRVGGKSWKVVKRVRTSCLPRETRNYHSYPDPDEKPKVSSARSAVEKKLDKSLPEFNLKNKIKLDVEFPGVPRSTGIKLQKAPQTLSTKLPNGLTVASQDTHGLMSSIAFLAHTGSAFEAQTTTGPEGNAGVTHLIELCSFRSTKNRGHQQLLTEIEQLGGMVQCLATRESVLYCIDVLRENLEPAVDILADAVLNAKYTPEEISECKEIVALQQNELPSEMLSRDAVQIAAYKGSPLGNTHFAPLDKLNAIDTSLIQKFRAEQFFGGNCFVGGVGVDHESFAKLIQEKFQHLQSAPLVPRAANPISNFTGGMHSNQRALNEPFVKIAIGFEVGGWKDPMLVASCVTQQLLGGGSSFSAGGPGKGMYTRLYREVLNQHHWVESAEAFVSIHEDAGLLGIDGACPPDYVSNMVRVIIDQLSKLAVERVTDEELNRAKNMLKSMMMMQLESRLVLCEDIVRQLVTYGKRESPADVCSKIDAITADDIMKVAQRMMKVPPAVGCVGEDLSNVPEYVHIKDFTEKYRADLKKKYSATW